MLRTMLSGIVVLILSSGVLGATTIYQFVYSGQSGAQTQIDLIHWSTWTFTITGTGSFQLAGGRLDMKDGSQTTADITLSVYRGSVSGTPLQSVTLTNSQFGTNHADPNSQKFATTSFNFPSPVTLAGTSPIGTVYIVKLTSNAPDSQNLAYFIKGGGVGRFLDSNNTPPPGVTITGGQQSAEGVPEPSTLSLTGLVGAIVYWTRLRRKASNQ